MNIQPTLYLRRHTYVTCVASLIASLAASTPLIAGTSVSELYEGQWCGEDAGISWKRTVKQDGTYAQFNLSFPSAEYFYEPHWEFGTWSIDDMRLTTTMNRIHFVGQEPRDVDPPFSFDFEIKQFTQDAITIEDTEFGLTYRSTRDCPVG